jgi:hypothetical protein
LTDGLFSPVLEECEQAWRVVRQYYIGLERIDLPPKHICYSFAIPMYGTLNPELVSVRKVAEWQRSQQNSTCREEPTWFWPNLR